MLGASHRVSGDGGSIAEIKLSRNAVLSNVGGKKRSFEKWITIYDYSV